MSAQSPVAGVRPSPMAHAMPQMQAPPAPSAAAIAPRAPSAPPSVGSPSHASAPPSPSHMPPQSMALGYGSQASLESPRVIAAATDATDASAFLLQLAAFGRELHTQATTRCDHAVIRVVRQRLLEWIEDVRSVGGLEPLAVAVEVQVTRLSTALAARTADALVAETARVAGELAMIAASRGPLSGPSPTATTKPRGAFWK
jgi:hypothetical protein